MIFFATNTTAVSQIVNFFYNGLTYGYPFTDNAENIVASYMGSSGQTSKKRIQELLAQPNSTLRIVGATNAFGMGNDVKNIKYIYHYGVPLSIEDLWQESGRGGRQLRQAHHIVLWTNYDLVRAPDSVKTWVKGDGTSYFCRRMHTLRYLEVRRSSTN